MISAVPRVSLTAAEVATRAMSTAQPAELLRVAQWTQTEPTA